jgi:hypothetical protein
MQIGRKIYYEKLTGNVLLDTGERAGDVVPTTAEQDFVLYTVLQQYVPDEVGTVQLEYGQNQGKFGVYNYSIDTTTGTLVWGTAINPDTPIQQPTIEEQLAALNVQMIQLYFTLVKSGLREMSEVPECFRSDVQALLDQIK